MTAPEPIPAATLILLRDRPGGMEVLMVERSRALAFAPGALVFPGGRVDPMDLALAGGDMDRAARLAALRETVEEAGLVPDGALPAAAMQAMRAALANGASLAEAATAGGWSPDPDALIGWARWQPPIEEAARFARVFDTRFYLARAADDAEGEVDGTENRLLLWARPVDLVAAAASGAAPMIYPTRRNIERLAQFTTFAEAAAHARAHPVRKIVPLVEEVDGVSHLAIPEGCGYPVTREPLGWTPRG